MPPAAPRIDSRLIAAMERFDQPGLAMADVHRRVGALAEEIGLTRPSYEQVRVLLHDLRTERRSRAGRWSAARHHAQHADEAGHLACTRRARLTDRNDTLQQSVARWWFSCCARSSGSSCVISRSR